MSIIRNKFSYKIEFLENGVWSEEVQNDIGGIRRLPWKRPFADKGVLDNSLDVGSMTLWQLYRKEPYKPFTPVKITVYEFDGDGNKIVVDEIYRLVSGDNVTQKAFTYNGVSREMFDHNISTIELTKSLERVGCETLSSTMYLGKHYLGNPTKGVISSSSSNDIDNTIAPALYSTPLAVGANFPVASLQLSGVSYINHSYWLTYYSWSLENSYTEVVSPTLGTISLPYNEGYAFEMLDESVVIKYMLKITYSTLSGPVSRFCTVAYTIDPANTDDITYNRPLKKSKSIAEVINRALDVIPIRREGLEKRRFNLDPAWESKLALIPSSEYFSPQKNLFENIAIAVSKVHLIPRLAWNKETDRADIITFDELGGDNEQDVTERVCAYTSETSIDDYCGAIDSTVSNIVNTIDRTLGTLVEPCAGGYKTLRVTEGALEIEDDTAVFLTNEPIYQVVKFVMRGEDGGEIDFTPFIYESAEYNALYPSGNYPYSKEYALTFKQGDNKIEGFSAKSVTGLNFINAFRGTVISNIAAIRGYNLSWFAKYKDLAFQLEYIPITAVRIIQKKVQIGEFPEDNTLIYNQGESTIEAQSYGENMKGAIARMGNTLETKTYVFTRYNAIPKIGALVEGKYVASVAMSFDLDYIKASITLAENYNQLMTYLGVNSNYRAYDVSEKQSYERQIAYAEDVIIGDDIDTNLFYKSSITGLGVLTFANVFKNVSNNYSSVTAAVARGISSSGMFQEKMLLPVLAQAYGNTIAFKWSYTDNYSAGYKSVSIPENNSKNEQRAVPYGDVYGEVHALDLWLLAGVSTDGYLLPQYDGDTYSYQMFSLGAYPLLVQKDSREWLSVNTMLCMRKNRKSIVVGSALSSRNPLVSKTERKIEVYFLSKKLNALNDYVDLERAVKVSAAVTTLISDTKITIEPITNTTGDGYKAWAIVNNMGTYAELILGENIEIPAGGATQPIYINFPANTWRG